MEEGAFGGWVASPLGTLRRRHSLGFLSLSRGNERLEGGCGGVDIIYNVPSYRLWRGRVS